MSREEAVGKGGRAAPTRIPLEALFHPAPRKAAEPSAEAPSVDWEERYGALERRASAHLAEAEARHQLEIDALKSALAGQETGAKAALAALDRAFADAIATIVTDALAAIVGAAPPLTADTLRSLIEEVVEALPEGSRATLYHAPGALPEGLATLPAIDFVADPTLPEGSFRASVGVGTISTSLSQRLQQLVQEIAAP